MATYRKNVYCEFEFLKKFRDSNAHFNLFEDIEALQLWMNIGKCIQKAQLMIDVSGEQFESQISSFPEVLKLGKKYGQGECVCSDKHKFKYVENVTANSRERVNTAYLIDKKEGICRNYANKYGIIAISPSCWTNNEEASKHTYLFRNCGTPIDEGVSLKWGNVFKEEYNLSNCNSIVVIDNYILKNLRSLLQILEALLPKPKPGITREDEFHLTVITAMDHKFRDDNAIFEQLKQWIKQNYSHLKCVVDLYVEQATSSNTFHDRYILTNNAFLKSGAGWDLLNKYGKANKQTDVSILHPGIQNINDSCDEEYMKTLNRAAIRVVNSSSQGQWRHYPEGEPCRNRLLVVEK